MPTYNYDVYIDDQLSAIFFERDLAFIFIRSAMDRYFADSSIKYTIRQREKGIAVDYYDTKN